MTLGTIRPRGWTVRLTAAGLAVGLLGACSGGDDAVETTAPETTTATSAEPTTAEPTTQEPTETDSPTPTESPSSEWTEEEQALIEEAEAAYLAGLAAYNDAAQEGFSEQSGIDEVMSYYTGEARNIIAREISLYVEQQRVLVGAVRADGIEPIAVSPESVSLRVCTDTTEMDYLIAGRTV